MRYKTLKKVFERMRSSINEDFARGTPPLKTLGKAYVDPFVNYPALGIGTIGDVGLLAATAGVSQKAETPTENALMTGLLGTGVGAGIVDDLIDRKDQYTPGNRKINLLKTLIGAGAGAGIGGALGYNLLGKSED